MQPFDGQERNMDMDASKTYKLIAGAIAALPYRRPSPAFAARVMARVAEASAPQPWAARLFKAAELTVTLWTSALVLLAGRLVYSNLPEIADLVIRPGGLSGAVRLLGARAALVLAKLAGAVSFCTDVLVAAGAGLPAWYEVAAAAVICCAAIAALSHKGRLAAGHI